MADKLKGNKINYSVNRLATFPCGKKYQPCEHFKLNKITWNNVSPKRSVPFQC